MTDEDAKRLDAIPRPVPLPADVAALMTEIEALKREQDALQKAADYVFFAWVECLYFHGKSGDFDEAMENLRAASQQRQRYLRAVGDSARGIEPLGYAPED